MLLLSQLIPQLPQLIPHLRCGISCGNCGISCGISCGTACCLFRLVVRTLPFHGSNGNSIFPRDSACKQKNGVKPTYLILSLVLCNIENRHKHFCKGVAKRSFARKATLCTILDILGSRRRPSLYGIQRQENSNTLSWTHFFTCSLV